MSRDGNFACRTHPAAQSAIGEQQWVTVSQRTSVCTELVDSMITLEEPRELLEKEKFELLDTSSRSKHSWQAAVRFAGE